ncbi:MAG: sigma-54-dependent Fis family transcriptional regulator [Alloprevotella sp.]|nr:sigma-54-dependent Fis family transcriptional regulator [Alloprevotella sp.]
MNETLIQRTKQRYDIIGNNEALNRALEVALKIAPVDLSVLITGENGVGKEVFPRIIHDNSLRKGRKYFAVNCGAIPEGTIDSELFGHEKGAFTGAVEKREGYFSVANGGTLFLDEVGELPSATQARLLRVLETGEYIPVGSSAVQKTDVRVIAATNMDMERAVEEGKFRQDLYYRLNALSITIPPLRERGDDIPLLFRKFALEMSEKYKMPAVRLTDAANETLKQYRWPGNVRQLKNLAENISVTSEERVITPEILLAYLPEDRKSGQLVAVAPESGAHTFENEREILYKILFDLRRDVAELKRAVGQGLQSDGQGGGHELTVYAPPQGVGRQVSAPATYAEAEEITEEERSSLSLEEQERELIRKALRLNAGRRKETAHELGISDRTLYRKIKEYGLDE